MNNKCVYSFIRILYKRGLIPKERIVDHLTNYDCLNPYLNAFFFKKFKDSMIQLIMIMNQVIKY